MCVSVTQGVLACNRHMLENQLACDIWFSVGVNQEKIGAHRYVLQSRSGVFFAMLDGPGADRSHMDLPDAQPKVFWQLLRLVAPLNFVLLCVCVGVLTLEVLQNAAFPVFWSIQWECFLMYHGIPQLLLLGVCTGICLMPLIWAWRSG